MENRTEAQVVLIDKKLKFAGQAGPHLPIVIDAAPPLGEGEGYTPADLLLVSLAGCAGATAVSLLRKMRKSIISFKVKATGIKREEHPKGFYKIALEFILSSPDIEEGDMQKAIELAEAKYCPVWAMLKGNVEIAAEYKIER